MLLLRTTILLTLLACAAAGNLRVGAARIDITPPADPAAAPPGNYAHEPL